MSKKLFKSKKENTTANSKIEKLNTKELGNVVGGGGGTPAPTGISGGKTATDDWQAK